VVGQGSAGALDGGGAIGDAGEGAEARDRRLELGRRPGGEGVRRAVEGDRAAVERDHAVGGGEAALEPVLGDDDRGPPLLVDAPQHGQQLVAGHGVELRGRLVEQQQLRSAGKRGAERHALELAAGQLARRSVEQVGDAERERGLLDATRHRGGAPAPVLEREGQFGADRRHHDLRLGILEQRPCHSRELGRPVLAGVEPAAHEPARERAAVEVRDEAGGGAQQR
jgi:hypothetical protein